MDISLKEKKPAFFAFSWKNFSFASIAFNLYSSSSSWFKTLYPAYFNPSRIDTEYLSFTSPEPDPPLTVLVAPTPAKTIFASFGIGSIPLFSSKTMPSVAILLARALFLISSSFASSVKCA